MKVFITREIKEYSPFHGIKDLLEISGKSLIKFNGVPFKQIPMTKWIYFYSSNGVRYFYEGLQNLGMELDDDIKIATIGEGTAKTFYDNFHKHADFFGNGSKEESIAFFEKNNDSILFVKGRNSLESVERFLSEDRVEELVVYENTPNLEIEIPDADIYVLTSPMNVDVYMQKACCRFNTKIIAIGQTTNQALIKHGFLIASVPDTPSEEAIVQLIKSMINE